MCANGFMIDVLIFLFLTQASEPQRPPPPFFCCCKVIHTGNLNQTFFPFLLVKVFDNSSPPTFNLLPTPLLMVFIHGVYVQSTGGFSTTLIHGMMYNPLTRRWSWISNSSVNYGLHAVKLHPQTSNTSSTENLTESVEKSDQLS